MLEATIDQFGFHPVICDWFRSRFERPTEPQVAGWPAIAGGENTLIAAPTGSGKTLTAFLSCIDRLLKDGLRGQLDEGVRVVYVSPLRALSNDMQRNLETPLQEICDLAADVRLGCPPIRAALRTGDTSSSQRSAIVRRPPHILVTTPESLYLMLTGPRSRQVLRTVETVIVDEIHALIRDKRGSHLSLTLERLESLVGHPLQRIGLSATQKPIERVAEFLVGARHPPASSDPSPDSLNSATEPEAGTEPSAAAEDGWHQFGRVQRVDGPNFWVDGPNSRPKSSAAGSSDGKSLYSNDLQSVGPAGQEDGWHQLAAGEKVGGPFSDGGEIGRKSLGPNDLRSRDDPEQLEQAKVGGTNQDCHQEKVGGTNWGCRIVDVGHGRELDLAVETTASELGAVCTHEQWAEINERVVQLVNTHRSTLIFVNTRRMAERVTHQLTELMGEDVVGSHHGSLSAELRLRTEQKLKSGQYKAVVATASLELGLDIGYIDLVIQLGSPRSIATFLQRIGRSGHSLGLIPKGRLFAMTRDQLLECAALIRAVRCGQLDTIRMPVAPLDVLAQQIVAEVVGQEWSTDELFQLCRRAMPYRDLSREEFDRTVEYLSEGISHSAGRSRVYLHHDQVQRRLRSRPAAQISATSNGGAIPEVGSYRVVAEPDGTVVGTLDEEFAIESQRGDIFLLGNTSWRLLGLRGSDVLVADAEGAPPSVPFWQGEAPGRTFELSQAVSDLREELQQRCADRSAAERWLIEQASVKPEAAMQAVAYVAAQQAAIGLVPTQKHVVFERFFDDTGGMQLVVHAPFGGDINRAWGFAMRKRFCRSFDFELQATADDDGFILSLGPQHSFPIESLFPMLTPRNARGLLEQAVLTVPMFQIRWRWNVTRALLVHRMQNGKKVPPALQRFRADDLLTAVFPKLTGCQEEHTGDHEVPDHPLAQQTMHDCLHEALDIEGLERVLSQIEAGEITLVARDTREPSPFSYELVNSNPYTFLDGGEVQERRARAVQTHRSLTVDSVADLATLDPAAISQVVREAQPTVRNADELHDVLLTRMVLPVEEGSAWTSYFDDLAKQSRAASWQRDDGLTCWVPAERLPAVTAAFGEPSLIPPLECPASVRREWTSVEARMAMVRGLVESSGPVTEAEVARRVGITLSQASATLEALEGDGIVLRGRFTAHGSASDREWCHRRLLSRIHRLTVRGLRAQIQPVPVDVYFRYLFVHHGLGQTQSRSGVNGLFELIGMLQGYDVPAVCWERDLLTARLPGYSPDWLDELCLTGEIGWGRFGQRRPASDGNTIASLTRAAPMSLWLRQDLEWLRAFRTRSEHPQLSSTAEAVVDHLREHGAVFARDLMSRLQLVTAQLDDVLGELVTQGMLTADGFAGLRRLISDRSTQSRRRASGRHRLERRRSIDVPTGRWSLWWDPRHDEARTAASNDESIEQWAWQLLRRWGVVFRDLLEREQAAPRWYELLQVYRRLEARGEIRGGRFVSGVAGEQFATGETVTTLRKLRDEPTVGAVQVVSAADPLNLVGIITSHTRVPATANSRIAFRDGQAVAVRVADRVEWLEDVGLVERHTIEHALSSTEAPSKSRSTRRPGLPRPIF